MCGRYTLRASPKELMEWFALFREPDWPPRYNIAPTQTVLTVRFDENATPREPVLVKWGLIPSWAKDAKIGNSLINARSETVATKPSFRSAFKRRRCLIPASGFYEWKKLDPKTKQPFHICMKAGKPFAMAGLWEHWDKGGEPVESCTIVTTEANDLMQPLHDRMPVILQPADYDAWLNSSTDPAALQELLRPYEGDDLTAYEVSRVVNNPRNETPECAEPFWAGGLQLE